MQTRWRFGDVIVRQRTAWSGNGVLMVQRPGEHHAVWHFWDGPEREFRGWYLNLQTAFERSRVGYATQDLELDVLVDTAGAITLKDDELLDQRIDDGRYTAELVDWIRSYGQQVIDDWSSGRSRVDPAWSEWAPPAEWPTPTLP